MRDDVLQPLQEPRVDAAAPRHLHRVRAAPQRRRDRPQALVRRAPAGRSIGSSGQLRSSQSSDAPPISRLRTAFCSAASKLRSIAITSPVAFICVPICAVAEGELVEGPARDLHHAVVQRRLEGRRRALRHRVRDLVQALADGDLRRDARDRVARRLARQRGAARHARVDLDDVVRRQLDAVARRRVRAVRPGPGHDVRPRRQPELDVAAAFDAQRADDLQRRRAQHLVLLVGQRLARRDDDAVAGVHAHRVEVLHVADRDAVVGAVAHHLVLDLFPAEQAALDQHLVIGLAARPPATMRSYCSSVCAMPPPVPPSV